MSSHDDDLGRGLKPRLTLGADGRLEGGSPVEQPPPPGPGREEPALELADDRRRPKVEDPGFELAHAPRRGDASRVRPVHEHSEAPSPRGSRSKWPIVVLLLIGGLVAWRLLPADTAALSERAREAGAKAVQQVGHELDALRPANDPLGTWQSGTGAEVKAGSEGAWKLRKLTGRAPTGVLTVMSSPAGAEITIDGKTIGYTPWAGDRVWPTGTEVELKLEGYRPWSETIQANGDVTLNAKLKR